MDRNNDQPRKTEVPGSSLSARRAWIEMLQEQTEQESTIVALRKESVDRNTLWEVLNLDRWLVALRKESVDRNILGFGFTFCQVRVALRKESVDRNFLDGRKRNLILMSLSARRAWIEILSAKYAL